MSVRETGLDQRLNKAPVCSQIMRISFFGRDSRAPTLIGSPGQGARLEALCAATRSARGFVVSQLQQKRVYSLPGLNSFLEPRKG